MAKNGLLVNDGLVFLDAQTGKPATVIGCTTNRWRCALHAPIEMQVTGALGTYTLSRLPTFNATEDYIDSCEWLDTSAITK